MRPLWRALLPLCAVALPAPGASAQTPSANTILTAARSVARVRARNCEGGRERAATAFLWLNTSTVVTARHVVAGCQDISLIFPGGASFRAVPIRELRRRDLVLMRLDRPAAFAPLQVSAGPPTINSRVAAVGYALGAPTVDSKLLDVTIGNAPPGSRLRDMLDDRFRDRLQTSGELDLTTLVLRLDGNLLPGLSGAPLIGSDGRVQGIGSGGLQEGAGGVVWAVRASYLGDLANGATVSSVAALRRPSGFSFADQTPQGSVAEVTCGPMTLRRSRTVQLSQLAGGSDDQKGLLQLASVFGTTIDDLGNVGFDIWVDADSGASVAFPAGVRPQRDGANCVAHVGPGVDLFVTAVDVDASAMVSVYSPGADVASKAFEVGLARLFPGPMTLDPSFSYAQVSSRPDGFVVRRLAFGGPRPTPQFGHVIADYAFFSHLVRGSRYVGVGGTRRDLDVDMLLAPRCQLQPNTSECQAARKTFENWARAALSVHLATMPPR